MTALLGTPDVDELREVVATLRTWQDEAGAFQLHPGDVGWFWRFGAAATAAALRTWRRDGALVAIGLLDGPDLLRVAFMPNARRDEELAQEVVADVSEPTRGVLPPGEAFVETPPEAAVHDLLGEAGWATDEPWTVLHRDLTEPVESSGLRVEVIGPEQAGVWAAVQRAAFGNPSAGDERWHVMAAGVPYPDARSLVAFDARGEAVAATTVWSTGRGRPGIIEPLGVHPDHRGRGHGRAISLAAATALRELGASSAMVATPSANLGAVTTYASAGLAVLSERRDRRRDG